MACPRKTSLALAEGNDSFVGADRLVLEATDELLTFGRAEASTWQRITDELGTHQAMELIFVVGTYMMLAMAFDTWGLAPPAGSAPYPTRCDEPGVETNDERAGRNRCAGR